MVWAVGCECDIGLDFDPDLPVDDSRSLGEYCNEDSQCESGLECIDTSYNSDDSICTYECIPAPATVPAAQCRNGEGLCIHTTVADTITPICFSLCNEAGACNTGSQRYYQDTCFCVID
jgi:hypothetical protein